MFQQVRLTSAEKITWIPFTRLTSVFGRCWLVFHCDGNVVGEEQFNCQSCFHESKECTQSFVYRKRVGTLFCFLWSFPFSSFETTLGRQRFQDSSAAWIDLHWNLLVRMIYPELEPLTVHGEAAGCRNERCSCQISSEPCVTVYLICRFLHWPWSPSLWLELCSRKEPAFFPLDSWHAREDNKCQTPRVTQPQWYVIFPSWWTQQKRLHYCVQHHTEWHARDISTSLRVNWHRNKSQNTVLIMPNLHGWGWYFSQSLTVSARNKWSIFFLFWQQPVFKLSEVYLLSFGTLQEYSTMLSGASRLMEKSWGKRWMQQHIRSQSCCLYLQGTPVMRD